MNHNNLHLDEQKALEKMSRFYEFFPYPNRSLINSPVPEAHLTTHLAFSTLCAHEDLTKSDKAAHIYKNVSILRKRPHDLALRRQLWSLLDEMNQLTNDNRKRIALVGCGTDEPLLFAVLHRNVDILALDLSKQSLRRARIKIEIQKFFKKIAPNINMQYMHGDATKNLGNFTQNNIDHIQCFGVIHHQPQPEKMLASIYQALKPGGTARFMLYANQGRQLERNIQKRFAKIWDLRWLQHPWAFTLNTALRLVQTVNLMCFWTDKAARFRYLGTKSSSIADAWMHPSDPGLSPKDFENMTKKIGFEFCFCEAKTYSGEHLIAFNKVTEIWKKICDADVEDELKTNITCILKKPCT